MFARFLAVIAWTCLLLPVQLAALRFRRPRVKVPMIYWSGMARILGLRLRLIGRPPAPGRAVLYVSNHTSWLDIVALGAVLPACFIAKAEVSRWPGIRQIANAGRTIFVSRNRADAPRERIELARRLAAGDNLILFPEGTTSDGMRVLPFRSSFIALAETDPPPVVQPVTIVYDLMDGLPICRRNRPTIAWYGDMEIASHYRVLGRHSWRASIVFGEPLDPALGRKELTALLEDNIAACAGALRQGRFTAPSPETA